MREIIYFDNAATTFPKPKSVSEAVADAITHCGGNPGRGSHILSERASELVFDTRECAAEMFGASAENVAFTLNATHALNLAIKGLACKGTHILIDNFAHNAVLRPAAALKQSGQCTLEVYDASKSDSETAANVLSLIKDENTLVVATHQSNISSKVLPIRNIGRVCAEAGCPFVVDASQSAGHLPVDLVKDGITSLCMPAHKGLYGIMGAGMLISSPYAHYTTIIEGGSGVASLEAKMPDQLPERLEAGTAPLPAIAALKAGMEFVRKTGVERIHSHESALAERFAERVKKIDRITIRAEHSGPAVSLTVDGISPSEVGEYLNERGICVRTGYHCAPLAHKTVGTLSTGSVRFGFSYFNTPAEVDYAADVLQKLCLTK